jgi:hypothetical protein
LEERQSIQITFVSKKESYTPTAILVDRDNDLSWMTIPRPTVEPCKIAWKNPNLNDEVWWGGFGEGRWGNQRGIFRQYSRTPLDVQGSPLMINIRLRFPMMINVGAIQGQSGAPIFSNGGLVGVLSSSNGSETAGVNLEIVKSFITKAVKGVPK